jgi:diguanylate cyclase (GGDEF)-like protein/PAS domain S-box-containing protein
MATNTTSPAAAIPDQAGGRTDRADSAELLALVGDIFESIPIATLVVAETGRIRLANHEAEQLLGYPRSQLEGQSVDMLVPEGLRGSHAARRESYARQPSTRRMGADRELLAVRADGALVPVEIALKPLRTRAGAMVIAVLLDISARKALEQERMAVNAELERRVAERTLELERSNAEKLDMLARLEAARAALEQLSRQDPLTGLANRREFGERAAIERERAERSRSPLSLAMLDIDRFKDVNDRHGHALGDQVLREIAAILQRECRVADLVSRYGGEEFALALPDTDLPEALAVCERIRTAIQSHDWARLRHGLQLSISIGVATRALGESVDAALARADALLYQAKHRGRNRVEGVAVA